MGSRAPLDLEHTGRWREAADLLEVNRTEGARAIAADALHCAQEASDLLAQAQALVLLACHDLEVGRFRRAVQAAERSAGLFQVQGALAGEAHARTVLSQALAATGRDDDAIEAGMLGMRLGELLPPGMVQVQAAFGLGMACLWSRSLEIAEAAFRDAERLAATLPDPASAMALPLVGLAWVDLMRLQRQRYLLGSLPDTRALRERIARLRVPLDALPAQPGWPGLRAQVQRLGRFAVGLAACWSGESANSRIRPVVLADRLASVSQPPDAVLQLWLLTEQAWASRQFQTAQRHAGQLVEVAGRAEFEPMACIGHVLRGQVFKALGRFDMALEEERAHRNREWRLQAERLAGRQRVVQAQLDMRNSLDHLRVLAQKSQELERLSFEDALTGIANRRCFEARLGTLLGGSHGASGDAPACLALIDLDNFKAINDTYSHQLGDEVLRSVARALRAAVREADLPARFGGDEFVVLFPHTAVDTARQVCERVRAQVAALRWEQHAPALTVAASIGVAQAMPGDQASELLQRADAAMFRAKGRRQALAAA